MLVVQDSDLHPAFFHLVQNDIHIPLPGGLAKTVVRPEHHTESPEIRVIDHADHLAVGGLVLPVDPQKGHDVG